MISILLLSNGLGAVGIRYGKDTTYLFEPETAPYTYKENIEQVPANACTYYANENSFDTNEYLSNFFQNFSIDSIESALHENFDTECSLLLNDFFKTKLYTEAKKSIDQFIMAILSDYHVDSNKTQSTSIDQDKDYQWYYLHNENDNIIGVAGSVKKILNLTAVAKSTKKEEPVQIIIDGCFSFPLLKIRCKRTCALKNINLSWKNLTSNQYCFFTTKHTNPDRLIPATNILTVDLLIEELPRFQWLVTFVNSKTLQNYIALNVDVWLGEKNSLIEETCPWGDDEYFMVETNQAKEQKKILTKDNIDIASSETPPIIF